MKTKVIFFLLVSITTCFGQIKIKGRVMDADSTAVPFAKVRFPGLSAKLTDAKGNFYFVIPKVTAEKHFLKGGVDLYIQVEKEGMVMLAPPDGIIRLPQNWSYQKPFEVYVCRKGSPLLARSERMLDYILRAKIKAAIEVKEQEFARRDFLAEEAGRLGLKKEILFKAVAEYKDRLRNSVDLNQRGLAALDDALEARMIQERQPKLDEAEGNFRESIRKDEHASREGRAAEARLSETYYNLGLVFYEKARYDSALVYIAKADSATPGDANKLTMLGRILDELAQYDLALVALKRAFSIDSTAYDNNHPNLAIILNNIGSVLANKGDYTGALYKLKDALRLEEAFWGHDHPNVARAVGNISFLMRMQGDYAGALENAEESLRINEAYSGHNHPTVATSLNGYALVLHEQGNYDEALKKFGEALRINEAYFGRNHPSVSFVLNNMALVHSAQNNYAEALEKYHESLLICETYYGHNHPGVAIRLSNIGIVLLSQGDYAGALEKFNEALRIDVAFLGHKHHFVAIRLGFIGHVLVKQGDYSAALDKFNEALRIDEATFGRNHPSVAIKLSNIAKVLEKQGNYAGAAEKTNEALRIQETFLGRNNSKVATKLNNIAAYLIKQSMGDSALHYLRQALPIAEKIADQDLIGVIYHNFGVAYKTKQDWLQAREWLERSIHFKGANVDAVSARTYFHLAGVFLAEGKQEIARNTAQKSLALAQQYKAPDLIKDLQALMQEIEVHSQK